MSTSHRPLPAARRLTLRSLLLLPCSLLLALLSLCPPLSAQQKLESKTTYAKAYGATKGTVEVDPAKDLPRYPAVEPKDAIATWQVKKGFRIELAAHEPQVRDPIAISFDEHGRMFACEMIDYSEMRDVTPHLGRISMLEDRDNDGYFETSKVFADDLPWPTGVICANGGIFVAATPDIWFFKDNNGDGKAEVREKVFTGFGTGLNLLNVQGLMNSFNWNLDCRIHLQCGGGNRGKVKCLKQGSAGVSPAASSNSTGGTPALPSAEIDLSGKDFWFDPRTYEFGTEAGGAQYGMSFDNYGRKFACSNSDHLQFFAYDDRYAGRNPYFSMPSPRQSVAVDGGAAEVFRISPDEPWRIIRTRWRIAGVVKGVVEGGGRVSGYFTGATGTTVYRGDACGPEFVNNTFTGDAGGQLIHRKLIVPDGVSVKGMRPADEQGFEFAASKDTWVRVVNFANAPDGSLHVCDMYREVIEHPWSIPDEIKRHLDLNSGNDRGRIYRIVPETIHPSYQSHPSHPAALRRGNPGLAKATTEELVKTLAHPNGWHRDTAARLLCERGDKAMIPLLEKTLSGDNALAKLHSLGILASSKALAVSSLKTALSDPDSQVSELACKLAEDVAISMKKAADTLVPLIVRLAEKPGSERARYQAVLSLGSLGDRGLGTNPDALDDAIVGALANIVRELPASSSLITTLSASRPAVVMDTLFRVLVADNPRVPSSLAEAVASMKLHHDSQGILVSAIETIEPSSRPAYVKAIATGFKRSGLSLRATEKSRLDAILAKATEPASKPDATTPSRIEAISLLEFAPIETSLPPLTACLAADQAESIQSAAVRALSGTGYGKAAGAILKSLAALKPKARQDALLFLLASEKRATALLEDVQSGSSIKAADFSASQVQALVKHANPQLAALAKTVLAPVIPPSREEVIAKFKPALTMKGDVKKGEAQFLARCLACHRANGQGIQVGPDLVTVKTKGREALLTAILEPHKEVAPQFIAYTVNTKDGQSLSGIVTKDEASSMTIKIMGGAEMNFPRANIKGASSTGQSLMPEGIEQGMDAQMMADLLDFIEAVK